MNVQPSTPNVIPMPAAPRAFQWLGKTPWKHQREIFERAVTMREYALFLEMGTGKTFTTINILRWRFMQAGRLMRTLVLCPPIVAEAWRREFEASSKIAKWVHVLRGSAKKRADLLKLEGWDALGQNGAVFITNYESLQMKDLYKLIQKWRPEVIVFDEAHKLKNGRAKRTKLAITLADAAKHRYTLTGSPILNTPMDIWGIFRILDCGLTFDRNFVAFRARYFEDKNAGMPKEKYFPKWRTISGIEPEFNRLIYQKASRVLKKDCLDLPPLVKKRLEVEMSSEQAKAYEEMKRHLIAYIESKTCVARIALTKALRLQQIVAGHATTDDGEVTVFEKVPRLDTLKEVVQEIIDNGHKVIVWACFKADVAAISGLFPDVHQRELVGGMTPKQQQEAIDSFQENPEVKLMIANQQAAGVGITLTAASYSVYYSRNFSLEADLQSESRNYRGGSEVHAKVTRVDLVCPKTIDEVVLQALHRKESMAEDILGIRSLFSGSALTKS